MAVSNLQIHIDAIYAAAAQLKAAARDTERLGAAAAKTNRTLIAGDKTSRSAYAGQFKLGRAFLYSSGQAGFLNSELSLLNGAMGNISVVSVVGAAGVGALALALGKSVMAAVDFESAITRVAKTANFSKSETKEFGDEILSMSRRLPVATSALADVSVVAGQLGISGASNIAAFTEEIAKLSSTTGVEAATLATQLGQIAQVTGIPASGLGKFSAALTQLGNDFNSTEGQVLDFTTRIAGIGAVVGLSAVQLAAISNAFASVGVEAERGGTAVQRVLIGMQEAAAQGGKELDAFAQITGLTAEAFRNLVKSNPAEAFTLFVEGLKNAGDQATVALDEVGLADARLTAAFLSVAAAGGLLRDSFNTASDAAAKGTATNDEFARSSATTAAQIQLLKNNLNATAVGIGTELLPAVSSAARGLNVIVDVVQEMGPLLKAAGTAALVLAAGFVAIKAIALVATISQLVAGMHGLTGAMRAGSVAANRLSTAIFTMRTAMIGIGLAVIGLDLAMRKLTGGGLIEWFTGAKEKAEKAARATALLNEELERLAVLQSGLGEGGGRQAFLRELVLGITQSQQELDALLSRKAELSQLSKAFIGEGEWDAVNDAIGETKERLTAQRSALAEINPSYAELAVNVGDNKDAQKALSKEIDASSVSYAKAVRTQGEYGAAVDDTASTQRDFQRELRETGRTASSGVTIFQQLAQAARDNTFAFSAAQGALKAFSEGLDIRSLEEIQLDRQIAEADALIAKYDQLGQEVPEDLQKWRDALEANRTVANAVTKAVTLNFEELAAKMVASGAEGSAAATALGENLRGLPEDLQLQIVTMFNRQGADDALEMAARLKELADHGISIPVAFDLMNAQANPQPRQFGSKQGLAEGGFVSASKQGELAMLHGNELVLPLDDKKRSMELLQQAGMRGFERGGFTNDAFFRYIMSGQLPPGLVSGASGGSAGGNGGLSELAAMLTAANVSAREFIATLELFDEQADAAKQAADEAERAKIELTKLSIVLGKEGITSEAFIAQQGLIGLRDEFWKSGMAVDEFILHIQGITQAMLAQGKALAKKTGKDVTSFSSTTITSDGVNYSIGGNLTDEGFEKVVKDLPKDVADEMRRQREESGVTHSGKSSYPKLHEGIDYVPRDMTANLQRGERVVPAKENKQSWATGNNFYGPVTVNATGSVDEAIRDLALHVR